ncbi:NEDD8-activating enzyme E1 regulatory subunit APP-BP1 [Phytophthora cactorum]|nr:NEDD8-activating enzyme E1 regulatory subunit APP-BP1 [Phytophthora cactorum]
MGDKYDRQLRLWGAEGQRRLANTRVLLAGSCATGSEALKNLVLPGVGRFSILDDANVSLADATNNFFVTADAVGQSRAETVAKLLLEMNADVAGDGRHANIKQVLQDEPQYLDQFDLVLATQLDEAATTKLAELCLAKRIPLLLVTSYGFLGSLRLQAAQHAIADAKLDPPRHELRLSTPFPTLRKFADSFALKSLSTIEHAHVPFVVLLLQAMKKWKEAHNGKPRPRSQRRTRSRRVCRRWPGARPAMNLTLLKQLRTPIWPTCLLKYPRKLLQCCRQQRPTRLSGDAREDERYQRVLAAGPCAGRFCQAERWTFAGNGVVPDMTASTESYVALQELYVNKAKEDATKIARPEAAEDSISFDAVAAFCKNAPNIGMLETRTVAQEYKHVDLSCVDLEDEDKEQSPLIWYFMLRAVAAFASEFNSYPGSEDATATQDRTWLVSKAKKLAAGSNVADWITDDHALEMTRSCQVELHNIAALMGGVAAQEAIKLITHQFEPLNHTYLFNGISGVAATYQL